MAQPSGSSGFHRFPPWFAVVNGCPVGDDGLPADGTTDRLKMLHLPSPREREQKIETARYTPAHKFRLLTNVDYAPSLLRFNGVECEERR
jgi:hypothetical protein